MLKYLCIILLFIVHICYSNYYDDNINWSNCEYVKSLSVSPFYVEGLPDIIKSTSIQLESLKIIVGSFSFNLCIAPSRENYYQILIKAVSMGLNENIQETSNFINDIISITDKIPEVLKNSSINDVEKWLRSQQMKAVRNGNGEEAKLYYSLYKKASIAKKYNFQISKIIESSQTIKESLMLLATCSSPIQYYDGVDNALESILIFGKDGIDSELRIAIKDVISLIRKEKSNFLVNLNNNKSQMLNIAIDLGKQIFNDNSDKIKSLAVKYLGFNNYLFISELIFFRQMMFNAVDPMLNLSKMSESLGSFYNIACMDRAFHNAAFQIEKNNENYVEAIKLLFLVESLNLKYAAAFFNECSKFGNYSEYINICLDNSELALEAFKKISLCNENN